MRFDWLLPNASYEMLSESWSRSAYRPRHGKPPLAVRSACSAAIAIGRARERYLDAGENEAIVRGADAAGARSIGMPKSG